MTDSLTVVQGPNGTEAFYIGNTFIAVKDGAFEEGEFLHNSRTRFPATSKVAYKTSQKFTSSARAMVKLSYYSDLT
jgi:hypothetical protein